MTDETIHIEGLESVVPAENREHEFDALRAEIPDEHPAEGIRRVERARRPTPEREGDDEQLRQVFD